MKGRSRDFFRNIPTFWHSSATEEAVRNSEALRAHESWESKVAVRLKKPQFVGTPVFDDLVRVFEPELRRFVSRKIDANAVEDVLQEVWIAAWQGLSSLKDQARIRSWIYGICLHKCQDHYRARQKDGRLVTITEVEILDSSPSPERLLIDSAQVSTLLENLDDAQKEVIELYYYAQLTFAEISTLLNRNINTVKYQFYRAHTTLLDAVEQETQR